MQGQDLGLKLPTLCFLSQLSQQTCERIKRWSQLVRNSILRLSEKQEGFVMKYTSVSLFRQVLDLISKREFEEVVMKHNGDLAAH